MGKVEVWLSLVEHFVRDEGAAGSNLISSVTVICSPR